MTVGRALALVLVLMTAALATACQGGPRNAGVPAPRAAAPPAGRVPVTSGLSPTTAFVTVVHGKPVRLRPEAAAPVLDAVWQILGTVGSLAPEPDGPRLLANLRLNEYLVDVTIWRAERLDVAGQRLDGVSGVVIPFTGAWRHRVLVVRAGTVEASPVLLDSPELATLERAVDAGSGHP